MAAPLHLIVEVEKIMYSLHRDLHRCLSRKERRKEQTSITTWESNPGGSQQMVNLDVMDTGVVKDIRARFKDESEIQLQEFLNKTRC